MRRGRALVAVLAGLLITATAARAQSVSQIASIPKAGTLQSAAVANGNGTAFVIDGYAMLTLTVNCSSCAGGTTVTFELSEDGTNYSAQLALLAGSTTIATSTTTAGITVWTLPVNGFRLARARISSYSAGTVTVTGHAVPVASATSVVDVANIPHVIVDTAPTTTVTGTVTTSPPANASTNLTQVGGVSVALGQQLAAASIPVILPAATITTLTPPTTVTANAGTNLNTSALALEAGHLATIDTNASTLAGAVTAAVLQENVKQVNGVTTLAGAGASGTGSQRITVAQDSTTVAGSSSLPAGSNVIGHVIADSGSTTAVTGNVAVTNTGLTDLDATVVTPGTTAPSKAQGIVGKTNDGTPQYQLLPEGAAGRSVIVEGIAGGTTVPISGTVTTTPPSNASTNVAQLAGTTTSVNSGVKDAGTLRVVLATDQPALTNKLLVTPDSVALPANQSVNVSQINGVTTSMGNGISGTGVQRVTLASDSTGQVALAAGSAIVGKVGIDQTTPGTTNGVQVNAALPAGSNVIGHVIADSGSTTTVTGNVTVVQPTGTNLHAVLDTTSTTAVTQATASNLNAQVQGAGASGATKAGNPVQVGGVFNTTQPTVTTGQAVESQYTARGAAIVATGADTFNATINAALPAGSNVIGHVITDTGSTTAVTGTVADNVTQFGGSNVVTGTGTSGAGIPRVTVSSDSSVTANQGTAAAITAPWPVKLTDGVTGAAIGTDGSAQVRCVNCAPGLTVQQTNGLRAPVLGLRLYGALGQALGDSIPVTTRLTNGPICDDPSRAESYAVSQATSAIVVSGKPGRRMVVCHYTVVGSDAENLSWVEGTGSACATNTAAVVGGTTAAAGLNLAANGGVATGDGMGWFADSKVLGNDLCLLQSGSGRVSGSIKVAWIP